MQDKKAYPADHMCIHPPVSTFQLEDHGRIMMVFETNLITLEATQMFTFQIRNS
jgi:hypothetical protein